MDWALIVRQASDIQELRDQINAAGKHARIVAKIEKPEAIEDFDAILEATDAVMVARGIWAWRCPCKRCLVAKRHRPQVHGQGQARHRGHANAREHD